MRLKNEIDPAAISLGMLIMIFVLMLAGFLIYAVSKWLFHLIG